MDNSMPTMSIPHEILWNNVEQERPAIPTQAILYSIQFTLNELSIEMSIHCLEKAFECFVNTGFQHRL
jgi:hypothetical protein